MTQDFSRKMTIVVRSDVQSWQLTNTVAHIAAYLGNKLRHPFDTGESFTTIDSAKIPRNSQYGIVTLSATAAQLKELANTVREQKLLWIIYTQEMIDLIDDTELETRFAKTSFPDLNILGIGLFAEKEVLKTLTKHLSLWK